VRANDPAHRWLFTPEAGVDVVASTSELVARLVQEELTAGDLVTLLRPRGAGVAVTETTLPPGAGGRRHPTSGPAPPRRRRADRGHPRRGVLLPDRAGKPRAGDVVVALCEPGAEHALHDVLTAGA
jgi:hypothetical protein